MLNVYRNPLIFLVGLLYGFCYVLTPEGGQGEKGRARGEERDVHLVQNLI